MSAYEKNSRKIFDEVSFFKNISLLNQKNRLENEFKFMDEKMHNLKSLIDTKELEINMLKEQIMDQSKLVAQYKKSNEMEKQHRTNLEVKYQQLTEKVFHFDVAFTSMNEWNDSILRHEMKKKECAEELKNSKQLNLELEEKLFYVSNQFEQVNSRLSEVSRQLYQKDEYIANIMNENKEKHKYISELEDNKVNNERLITRMESEKLALEVQKESLANEVFQLEKDLSNANNNTAELKITYEALTKRFTDATGEIEVLKRSMVHEVESSDKLLESETTRKALQCELDRTNSIIRCLIAKKENLTKPTTDNDMADLLKQQLLENPNPQRVEGNLKKEQRNFNLKNLFMDYGKEAPFQTEESNGYDSDASSLSAFTVSNFPICNKIKAIAQESVNRNKAARDSSETSPLGVKFVQPRRPPRKRKSSVDADPRKYKIFPLSAFEGSADKDIDSSSKEETPQVSSTEIKSKDYY